MKDIIKCDGAVKPNSYIVTMKDGVVSTASTTSMLSSASEVTHNYTLINGYAGIFTEDDLNTLRSHDHIESIEEDSIMQVYDTQ